MQSTPDLYDLYALHQGITRAQAKDQILRYAYNMEEIGPSNVKAFLETETQGPWTIILWSFNSMTLVEAPISFKTKAAAEQYARDERTAYADFYGKMGLEEYPRVVPQRANY